jgi:hypothetical protein
LGSVLIQSVITSPVTEGPPSTVTKKKGGATPGLKTALTAENGAPLSVPKEVALPSGPVEHAARASSRATAVNAPAAERSFQIFELIPRSCLSYYGVHPHDAYRVLGI